jgi:hypothetical protein
LDARAYRYVQDSLDVLNELLARYGLEGENPYFFFDGTVISAPIVWRKCQTQWETTSSQKQVWSFKRQMWTPCAYRGRDENMRVVWKCMLWPAKKVRTDHHYSLVLG